MATYIIFLRSTSYTIGKIHFLNILILFLKYTGLEFVWKNVRVDKETFVDTKSVECFPTYKLIRKSLQLGQVKTHVWYHLH